MTTCWHLRGPTGMSTVAMYLHAIALTVERCLPASVLSSEVSITQCRPPGRDTSWASRQYRTTPAYSQWFYATMVKSSSRSSMPRCAGLPMLM